MKPQVLTDELLTKTIYDRIKWDIRVNRSDIMVSCHSGRVTLAGYFDKSYRHAAAVDIIESTAGVEEFVDQSQVVLDYFRTDEELKCLIKKQVDGFRLLRGEWIEVAVTDGVVKLEGVVFRPRIKSFASSYSWGLSGTQDCMNMIAIRSPLRGAHHHKGLDIPLAFPWHFTQTEAI